MSLIVSQAVATSADLHGLRLDLSSLKDKGFRPGAGPGECRASSTLFSGASGVKTGLWRCEPGSFDVCERANTESVLILEGKIRLTDLKKAEEGTALKKGEASKTVGASRTLSVGNIAVLELGSAVRWDILETCVKMFVIADKIPSVEDTSSTASELPDKMDTKPHVLSGLVVGAYATVPKGPNKTFDRDGEAAFYAGLAGLERAGAIEIQFNGKIHSHDEGFLMEQLTGCCQHWGCVLTCIGGTMERLGANPLFGLASDDESGRQEAIAFAKEALDAVTRLNETRTNRVIAVQVHSGPNRRGAAEAGGSSSQASFARSLQELLKWDWQGASLVVEHCDAYTPTMENGFPCSKGFLALVHQSHF
jgi:uncharacterized cupin superfamily protein